jgi:hypothetical protein
LELIKAIACLRICSGSSWLDLKKRSFLQPQGTRRLRQSYQQADTFAATVRSDTRRTNSTKFASALSCSTLIAISVLSYTNRSNTQSEARPDNLLNNLTVFNAGVEI